MPRLFFGLVVLALAIACSESIGPTPPPPVPTSQLHFVLQDRSAPPLLRDSASFYAKLGENREVRMYYQGVAPGDTGDEFLRFEVPNNGLFRKPDGSPFLPGDSILITIKVLDPAKFVFEFQPTGLQFNPDESSQARLKIEYFHSDHDFNSDGRIDSADAAIETELDIWQRQPPDTLWHRLGAVKFESLDELDAKIQHFTDHAIAW